MDPALYNTFLSIAAAMFVVSFLLTTWRIVKGPNSMDRLVGMDGFIAMFQCAMAVYICWTLDTTVSNAMLVVALLGFISTVSVTRFRKRDN
ncbi:MAG: monovalent cation/H+ antiporter complex subunit F [Corynebacterium casei]|jgi:multicomponent Na+:H+ antiporter subunit F|uniref:Na(+)/H(+) antiporter subunit F n=2 Tax=Corynebacterium casei TaxID=160386 RepID=G7HY93_9CORY|nr:MULTISPECIES: monovalent cation/H+ antiporter complex subunit F [Corynebacterium]AHI21088.1 monovalent cation/H+ antiporter subunit F [Corynebacterium casei LMG S-19264]MDN5705470.1 monovalent cation/H+ antiporter complex subunit F [Corynebacterium casei]MDN5728079.1 monovalent cation/H+ antiporter complex subunit F [Corynebacterium casei]MDN5739678.1 monovalent cation/H+ antiporter complex subunit F [Corynebacterium casei]MDN5783089.1 monovalent cation/H+ antiporter complex subunit F [Cory